MREFKFRAWDIDNSAWIYSGHLKTEMSWFFNMLVPLNYVLEQYTGIKDLNGKEIYEGDIISWVESRWSWDHPAKYEKVTYKHLVEYYESACEGYPYIGFDFPTLRCEVIGNIHENPELLDSPK